MVEKPFIIPQPILPLQPQGKPQSQQKDSGTSFEQILTEKLQQSGEIKFSKHAIERLDSRNITLDKQHLNRLQDAVQKAQAKGSKESLVLLDDLALVVSIKNKTVITAVDGESRKGNIFTNIDSAVII